MLNQRLVFYTFAWLLFSVLWGAKALVIRRNRNYAKGRELSRTSPAFKYMSYFAFVIQLTVVPVALWSDSKALLIVFRSDVLIQAGLALCYLALGLYLYSFKHLGKNYSPCFDSHLPFHLVDTGPYHLIRHPGWLSKILVSTAGFLLSGSLWLLPILLWILAEMKRTVQHEEAVLHRSLPGYGEYKRRTKRLLPWLF